MFTIPLNDAFTPFSDAELTTWPFITAFDPALICGSSAASAMATPFMLSIMMESVGMFSTRAGSPSNAYWSLLMVLSLPDPLPGITSLFFATRCASPTDIYLPSTLVKRAVR